MRRTAKPAAHRLPLHEVKRKRSTRRRGSVKLRLAAVGVQEMNNDAVTLEDESPASNVVKVTRLIPGKLLSVEEDGQDANTNDLVSSSITY
jgi:hypothetical protein